jgi:hypothetical protein
VSRLLTRVITELSFETLPDFLYKGLHVPADALNKIKADEFWSKDLQLLFQTPMFMVASSSLTSLADTPGTSPLLCLSPAPPSTSAGAGVNVLLIIESLTCRGAQSKGSSAKKVPYYNRLQTKTQLHSRLALIRVTSGESPQLVQLR